MKDKKFKKNQKNKYVDPNSLKESGDSSNPYLKELAALAAILGTGATGAAILPNDRVYAAQTSVDAKSQIVGSVSESTQTDLSKKGNSKSDENGVSTSNSEAKSMSTSSSKSLRISRSASTSLSQSQQISQSMSLSNSQSLSESLSYSKSKLNSSSNTQKKISNSETHSTFKSSKNKKISEENSLTSSSNTNRSSNKTNIRNFYSSETSSLDRSQGPFQSNTSEINSLSLSSRQLIGENFQIPVVIQNSINNSSDNKTQTNNKKLQIDKLNLTGVFTNLLQINDENAVDVSTSAEFQNALNNSTVNAIRLTANIDLGQSSIGSIRIPPRNLTIDGANHDLNLGNNCIWLNNSASPKTTTIIKSLNLYTANNRGGFALTNSGAETLIYDNVHATGGAAVFADTYASSGYLKTFEIQGHTTIDGVNSYQYNGNTYDTSSANFVGYSTLLYAGNDLIVDDNASLIINNNMSAYDVAMLANNGEHAVRVGENATLRINNTYSYSGGEIWNNVGNIALTNGEAEFTAGKNSNINLSTSGANIYIASGSTNNTVNFEAATNTTFSGNTNFYFGGSDNTVNIDDPAHVILNTTTGTTYSTNSSNLTINATDTNVIVTKNGVTKRSNYFANNRSTVNGTNYTIGITIGEQNNGETAVKNVMADINKSGTTRVEYTSETQHSESISDSIRTSESISTAIIESESTSASERESESLSNSVSMSESLSNSVSMSESLSNSVSMSESLSNSVSMSESLSNSVSMSESLSNSVSMSESLSNSVSMSESLSNSVSMSESLSNSVSTSESLSNSVSMNKSQSRSTPNNSSTQSTSTDTLQPKHKNAESVDKAAKKDHRRGKLPQTGAESNSSFLGLMIAALGGLLGFRRKKRKDEDKD